MNFKSKAKSGRRCAFAQCATTALKIYEDDSWRIIACSQAHADIARKEIDKVPVNKQSEYFK